jgi:hypothetical protein
MTTKTSSVSRNSAALLLIAFGALFLLGQFGILGGLLSWGWPLLVFAPGAFFMYQAYTGGKGSEGFAVPGMVVGGTGLILLFQSITDHWASWAYAWALYPVFVGLALDFIGQRTANDGTIRAGQGMVRWGLLGFGALAAFFELFIFNSGGLFGTFLLPVGMILAGVYLFSRRNNEPRKRKTADVPLYTGARLVGSNGKRTEYGLTGDRLQQEIDAALAEEDAPKTTV